MASRVFEPMMGLVKGHRVIAGSFRPQGSSAPADVRGRGFTVARTSAGLYTLTFQDSYQSLVAFMVGMRETAGTATMVQGGAFSAANKTQTIRVLQAGSGTARTKTFPLDLSSCRLATRAKIKDLGSIGVAVQGTTPFVVNTTTGGMYTDADSKTCYVHFRVPEDWDQTSDLTFRIVWHPEAGTAPSANDTVKFITILHTPSATQAVDAGTAVTTTTTYTQSGAGTDKQERRTDVTIAGTTGNQTCSPGDSVYITLSRDKTNDTYTGKVVVTRFELQYNAILPLIERFDGNADGPYLERVNGATDPTLRAVWPAGDVTPLQFPPMQWPTNLDDTASATVRFRASMSGATDTPTLTVAAFEEVGDTDFGGATAALSSSVASATRTLAASDIQVGPNNTVNMTVAPGTHGTDKVYLYSAAVDYTSTENPNSFALTDLADDADNVVNFVAHFRDSTVKAGGG